VTESRVQRLCACWAGTVRGVGASGRGACRVAGSSRNVPSVDLTSSYERVIPDAIRVKYELRETRNAAAILASTSPEEFEDILDVLGSFQLTTADLVDPGGNESKLAARLNGAFRDRGWREGRYDTRISSELRIMPYPPAGETSPSVIQNEVFNEGYKVDNVNRRVALDVEWNAKDGNLDRDIGAYRALYDAGIVDVGVLVTRTMDDLRALAQRLALEAGVPADEARKRLGTTTTTNLPKLLPRMTRGDAGGCPLLAVAISERCWVGS